MGPTWDEMPTGRGAFAEMKIALPFGFRATGPSALQRSCVARQNADAVAFPAWASERGFPP